MAVGWQVTIALANKFKILSTTRFPVFVAILKGAKVLTIVMNVETRYLKRVELQ